MKAITLRNVPPRLVRQIERKARENRTSLNQAVIALLDETTPPPRPKRAARTDLSFLVGSWTKAEAAAFEKSLASQRTIDPELWQ